MEPQYDHIGVSFCVSSTAKGVDIGLHLHNHDSAEAQPTCLKKILSDLESGTFSFTEESFPLSTGVIKSLRSVILQGKVIPESVKYHGFGGYAHGYGISFKVEHPDVNAEKGKCMALGNAGDHY